MQRTKIEWTDWTVNPIRARNRLDGRTGHFCLGVSPGCGGCYASAFQMRFGTHLAYEKANRVHVESYLDEKALDDMVRRPRAGEKVFVCDMTDLFLSRHHDAWIKAVLDRIESRPDVIYQILTKRPIRATSILRERYADRFPPTNFWLGVSVESPEETWRIHKLLECPAGLRFLSLEPLLGLVDLRPWLNGWCPWCGSDGEEGHFPRRDDGHPGRGSAARYCPSCNRNLPRFATIQRTIGGETLGFNAIGLVLAGGESGSRARPMHPDWPRAARDACVSAAVPFFFKQWGAWSPFYDRDVDDPDWRNVPREGRGVTRVNVDGGHGFHGKRVVYFRRFGKKRSGRLLDGREWNEMPNTNGTCHGDSHHVEAGP